MVLLVHLQGRVKEVFWDLLSKQAIFTLIDDDHDAEMIFKTRQHTRVDIVIGADALHSNTCRLVFDEKE